MFCIKCFTPTTQVTNSRPAKKEPRIWRRRHCRVCGYTFTTHENIVLEDYLTVEHESFSTPRLAWSLTPHLPAGKESADNAYWLARTVGEQLLKKQQPDVSRADVIASAHTALNAFDPAAGMRYGLAVGLVEATSRPRRGRPRVRRP